MSMVKRPTLEQMRAIVAKLHMSMSDHEVGEYLEVLEGTMQAYDRVDALPIPVAAQLSPRARPKESTLRPTRLLQRPPSPQLR